VVTVALRARHDATKARRARRQPADSFLALAGGTPADGRRRDRRVRGETQALRV